MKRNGQVGRWLLLLGAGALTLLPWLALSQEGQPTSAQLKRDATLKEFVTNNFEFAQAFHAALSAQMKSNGMTAAQYAAYSSAFWAAFTSDDRAGQFETLYDTTTAAARRLLQMSAFRLLQKQRTLAEAAAARATSDTLILQ